MQRSRQIFLAFTKKERTAFLFSSAAAFVSFVVVMSYLIAQGTSLIPAAGGAYTEGMIGQPEYVNPVTAASETDRSLVKMIYSNIFGIADSIQVSPDGRTWTVRLKENLRWQDGEPLTSDDVAFTVASIQDPDAASPLAQSWQGVAVTRVSELELQFSLINPSAFFGDTLRDLYIIPKHLFANVPPGNWHLSDYNLKPVGSGPYEFISYEERPDGTITAYHLKAWSGYAGAKPLIAQFSFAFFENAAGLVGGFNTGAVDGAGGLSASDLSAIARPYDLYSWRTSSYYAVFWNQSRSVPLEDPAVREALASAVDRDALVADVLGGHGAPEYGPIPPGAPYFAPTPVTSSMDFASATLTQAGWLVGADGTRSKKVQTTVVPLVVNLSVPNVDFLVKTADEVSADWQSIGAVVNVTTTDPQALVSGSVKNRDYESLLFGNILGPSSDLYAFWDSSQRFSPGLNLAIYSNKHVDSLIEAARMELGEATRTVEFAHAQGLIATDYPAAFLYSPDYLYVTDKGVQGMAITSLADPSDRFRGVAGWYLNTARALK